MKPITYISDQAVDYADGLSKCDTLPKLVAHLQRYKMIASDALATAPKDEAEFKQFRVGFLLERKRKFAGEKWALRWSQVLLPEVILMVGMLASQCHAPWGCAYIQAKKHGAIAEEAGVGDDRAHARWVNAQ